jgi:hypothetical protein
MHAGAMFSGPTFLPGMPSISNVRRWRRPAMTGDKFRWMFVFAAIFTVLSRQGQAQSPTLPTEFPQALPSPGSETSALGPTPGTGGGSFASPAVGGGQILGGRPGTATPRVPSSISTPGAAADQPRNPDTFKFVVNPGYSGNLENPGTHKFVVNPGYSGKP